MYRTIQAQETLYNVADKDSVTVADRSGQQCVGPGATSNFDQSRSQCLLPGRRQVPPGRSWMAYGSPALQNANYAAGW